MKHDSFNESAEMYLKTVSELAIDEGPVPISALAGRLGVSTVSATEMVHRLKDHGLIEHRPYKGICLTECGHRQASEVIRSHRLWERFLVNDLGLAWDKVHSLACRLEHATDLKVVEALDAYLGYPETCPHGNPIPRLQTVRPDPEVIPLTTLQAGDSAVIDHIHPETDELLEHLAELELTTGMHILLLDRIPFHGPLVLKVGDKTQYLSVEAAEYVFCRPIKEA